MLQLIIKVEKIWLSIKMSENCRTATNCMTNSINCLFLLARTILSLSRKCRPDNNKRKPSSELLTLARISFPVHRIRNKIFISNFSRMFNYWWTCSCIQIGVQKRQTRENLVTQRQVRCHFGEILDSNLKRWHFLIQTKPIVPFPIQHAQHTQTHTLYG